MINITDINDPRLDIFGRLKENQLAHYFEPAEGLFMAESPLVAGRALDAGYEPYCILADSSDSSPAFADILSRVGSVPVYTAPEPVLLQITGFKLTRGLLCAMRRKPLPEISEVLKYARRIAVLEDVVNPTNLGAIFRSAAALGIDAVLLTSSSADPLQRRCARVSMGNIFLVPWTYFPKNCDCIKALKDLGFKTAAMALSNDSISIADPRLKSEERLAIILGSEGPGLKAETIEKSDYVVKIPMAPGVDSLNVAAASAVAFWEISRN